MENPKEEYEALGSLIIDGKMDIGSAGIFADEPVQEFARYRTNTEMRHLKNIVNLEGKNVLDLGCGPGRLTFELANVCRKVTGVDFCTSFIVIANRIKEERRLANVQFFNSSLADFTSPELFDVVFVGGVFVYVSDEDCKRFLHENLPKLLKPDGVLIVRDPITYTPESKASRFGVFRSQAHFLSLFEGTGFNLVYNRETYLFCPPHTLYMKLPAGLRNTSLFNWIFRLLFAVQALIDPLLLRYADYLVKKFGGKWTIKQKFFVWRKDTALHAAS